MGDMREGSWGRIVDDRLGSLKDAWGVGVLPLDESEVRVVGGGNISGRTVKTSMSNWSASSGDKSIDCLSSVSERERSESAVSELQSSVVVKRYGSWRYGISMLERTSWSSNPSISISCIFARETNLRAQDMSICVSMATCMHPPVLAER